MQEKSWNPSDIKLLAEHLSALGNANRLAILESLGRGETQVNVLAKKVGLGQSALSQHLAILRGCNFVGTRRVSQAVFYSVRHDVIAGALGRVQDLLFACRTTADDTLRTTRYEV
jgi:DNA-binding transcriptional ArsR family regulator